MPYITNELPPGPGEWMDAREFHILRSHFWLWEWRERWRWMLASLVVATALYLISFGNPYLPIIFFMFWLPSFIYSIHKKWATLRQAERYCIITGQKLFYQYRHQQAKAVQRGFYK